MEADHDLRKFITELPVAQRGVVLSSGREVDCDLDPSRVTVQYTTVPTTGRVSDGCRVDRGIRNVGRLTPETGIEGSTTMSSDQTAAEALQEAGTELGAWEWSIGVRTLPLRSAGQTYRSAYRSTDLGLTA